MTQIRKKAGLTLIELVVTIAIVGILAAIAIPSYEYYTQTSKRSAAKGALQQVRGLEEQYYTNNKSYTSNLTNLGFNNSPVEIDKTGNAVAAGSSKIVYEISVNLSGSLKYCNSSCDYEVVATAKNTQVNDKKGACAVLWFNSLGQKGSAKLDGTDTTSTADCW